MSSLAALFGHWAILSASCATGFAVSADHLTLYAPMGFENHDLPAQTYKAEPTRRNGLFIITYTGADGAPKEIRFTVENGDRLVDDAGYEYRRCPSDKVAHLTKVTRFSTALCGIFQGETVYRSGGTNGQIYDSKPRAALRQVLEPA